MPKKYETIEQGIPFDLEIEDVSMIHKKSKKKIKLRGVDMNLKCCDCGLVHNIMMLPSKTKVKLVFFRDNRKTAAQRRGKRMRIDGLEVATCKKKEIKDAKKTNVSRGRLKGKS